MNPTIVLHRPQDLVNIAVIIRAMKNFGFRDLRLVDPGEFNARRIEGVAHKTSDIIERVQFFDSLDAALSDLTHVVGLTARGRTVKRNMVHAAEAVTGIRALADDHRAALLFGPEDRGLTNEDLDRCHRVATIPTAPEHPSMNLAQAATLMMYECYRAAASPPPFKQPRRPAAPATREHLEQFFADAEQALSAVEFFKSHTADSIMRTIREVVHRADLDQREVKLIRAICLETVHFMTRKGLEPE